MPMFVKALFNQWVDKRKVVIHKMEYFSAINKSEILPLTVKGVEVEDIMLSEIAWQSQVIYVKLKEVDLNIE